MKRQVIILLLSSIHASAQNAKFPELKISTPCNQQYLDNYKGKWLIPDKTLFNSPNKNFSQEALKHMGEIHKLVEQVYPQPMGSDAYRNSSYTKNDFGYAIKYVTQDDRIQMEYVKRTQVEGWHCSLIL